LGGGVGNSNGPGDTNGPPFNGDINALAGETYVLMVSDWSSTPDGYTLDFSASTAELFDATEPSVTAIDVNCDDIVVTFSENIDCNSLDFDDFQLEQNGEIYTVSDINSDCNAGEVFPNEISLSFTPDIPSNGMDFTFSIVGGFGSVTDMCGNPAPIADTTLVINIGITMDIDVTNAGCNSNDGIIEVINPIGGLAPYTYTLNGDTQTSPIFSGLPEGVYEITIADANGCSTTESIEVGGLNGVTYDNGGDAISCSLAHPLTAQDTPGFLGTWTTADPVTFSDVNNPNATATSTAPGEMTLIWTIDNGMGCIISDELNLTFTDIDIEFETTDALCLSQCNGQIEVLTVAGGMPVYSMELSNGTSLDNSTAGSLCPGGYFVTVSDANDCAEDFDFVINQTSFFALDSTITLNESCKDFCDGQIEVFADNATQYSINNGLNFSSDPVFTNVCNGQYNVIARDMNMCEDEETVFVSHPLAPTASFSVLNPSVTWDNPVFEMSNNSQDYVLSYWSFGCPNILLTSEETDPVFVSPSIEIGTYEILLVVEDEIGCRDSTFRAVEIRDDILVYIPNSFTPNEDGINDVFRPVLNEVDPNDYELIIYDRYGNQVFVSNDMRMGWNGQGKIREDYYAPNGIYSWQLNFKSLHSAERVIQTGWVSLIR